MTYRRYPPDPGSRRVWWLIALLLLILIVSIVHQGGS